MKRIFFSLLVLAAVLSVNSDTAFARGGLTGAMDDISNQISSSGSDSGNPPHAAQPEAPAKQPTSGSAYDPATGVTTSVQSNPDGSRTITQTDSDGKVLGTRTEPKAGSGSASGSAFDPSTGVTTSVEKNADGSKTITQTNADGKVIGSSTLPPSVTGSASGSAYDPATGITTSVQGNPDGSRTVTKTDSDGKVIETVTKPKQS